jgi:hypothetical protein
MTDFADRLAKLLRRACSTGPDGEKLAALNRISAIVEANNVDWDLALSNGNRPLLTEENMRRIFDEGYTRGASDERQKLRPERDWTPAAGTSHAVGTDADRLELILTAARASAEAGLLNDWERTFAADMLERFERYGERLYVSEKQWSVLDRLEIKLRRQNFID